MTTLSKSSDLARPAGADHEEGSSCPFLEKLPIEIREIIYRYVLMEKVMNPNSTRRRQCRYHFRDVTHTAYWKGPTYNYRFHTAILCVNHQISNEAKILFHRENVFVRLTFPLIPLASMEGSFFKYLGLPIVAEGHKARLWPNTLIKLELEPLETNYYTRRECQCQLLDHKPDDNDFVFFSEDISTLCIGLERSLKFYLWITYTLNITIDPTASHVLTEAKSLLLFQPKLKQILNPVRYFDLPTWICIGGPLSAALREELEVWICTPPDDLEQKRKMAIDNWIQLRER